LRRERRLLPSEVAAGKDMSGLRGRGRAVISSSSSEEDDDDDDEEDEDEDEDEEVDGDAGSSSPSAPLEDTLSGPSESLESLESLDSEEDDEPSISDFDSGQASGTGSIATSLLRLALPADTLPSLSDRARFLNATVIAIGTDGGEGGSAVGSDGDGDGRGAAAMN